MDVGSCWNRLAKADFVVKVASFLELMYDSCMLWGTYLCAGPWDLRVYTWRRAGGSRKRRARIGRRKPIGLSKDRTRRRARAVHKMDSIPENCMPELCALLEELWFT